VRSRAISINVTTRMLDNVFIVIDDETRKTTDAYKFTTVPMTHASFIHGSLELQ